MKIPRRKLALFAGLLIVLLAMAADTVVVVKIQTTAIRQNPQFFAPVLLPLKAGDKLTKVGEANGWIQVKTQTGLVGWIHSSAVEVPKLNLLASNDPMKTQAKASEVALAGKGF
ncbi:MAG: SH3 domain-containing protein, partial [Candidatus Aminicenantales bacterium]